MRERQSNGFRLGQWATAAAGLIVAIVLGSAARAEEPSGPGPAVKHVPVTTATRGVPVDVSARVDPAPGTTLTSAVVLVRITDLGKPVSVPMTPGEEPGFYHAVVPVTMIRGISVFWYALDIRDDTGAAGGTPWIRVVIGDAILTEGGVAAVEGGSAGGISSKNAWIAGGLLVGAGAAAVLLLDDDDDKKQPTSGAPVSPPAPASSGTKKPTSAPKPAAPTACITTGSETLAYEDLEACDNGNPIRILICGACPDANVRVNASWGASDTINGYNNPNCSVSGPRLTLAKPDDFPEPLTESFTVYANNAVIATVPWPPASDFDCW
ncbi:MAG TPA: hypothetical protein PKE26_17200 [Kiritimatiellia bacterium]|nr:hypothetical protein [Kiritimatiellia bacterium]HMP00837.1 hypothetical protein [Kiritimatiellia bacterium]HMP98116.1 hypothetical protein [Kiritimatiellia bacterium]